jgi:3-oxoadipate enol-lactonase
MERFVDVPGGRLFAVEEGSGPPLVLIHAAIVDLHAWDEMVPGLVAAHYRVIRYDLRGFGRSVATDVDFDERADLRAVLDAFGVGKAAVVGNSRGGFIAIDTAIETPDRVAALVTLGSSPGGFEVEETALEQALTAEEEALLTADPRDPEAITDFMVRVWVDGPGQPSDRVPAAMRETIRQAARQLYEPGHVRGRPTRMTPPANDRLADLRCPVLAVVGGLDISQEVDGAERLATAAPNARAVVWPDVGHMIGLEQPDRLVVLVTDFLAPLRPWA